MVGFSLACAGRLDGHHLDDESPDALPPCCQLLRGRVCPLRRAEYCRVETQRGRQEEAVVAWHPPRSQLRPLQRVEERVRVRPLVAGPLCR